MLLLEWLLPLEEASCNRIYRKDITLLCIVSGGAAGRDLAGGCLDLFLVIRWMELMGTQVVFSFCCVSEQHCSLAHLFRHPAGRISWRQQRHCSCMHGRQEPVVSGLIMQGHLQSSSKWAFKVYSLSCIQSPLGFVVVCCFFFNLSLNLLELTSLYFWRCVYTIG